MSKTATKTRPRRNGSVPRSQTASPETGKTLSTYITERFDEFSRSQKDVARYIVDHLEEAAFQTAEELARRANTSSSTVVRFSQALGFDGYPELQQAAIEEYRTGVAAGGRRAARRGSLFDFDHTEFEASLAADHANIESTVRGLTREQVEDVRPRARDRPARRDRRDGPDGLLRLLPAAHAGPARHPRRDASPSRARSRSPGSATSTRTPSSSLLGRPGASARRPGDEARPPPRRPHDRDQRRDPLRGRRARRAHALLVLGLALLHALDDGAAGARRGARATASTPATRAPSRTASAPSS